MNWHPTEQECVDQNPQPSFRTWNDADGIFHVDCGLCTHITFEVALQLVNEIIGLASSVVNVEGGLKRRNILLIHAPFIIKVDEAASSLLFSRKHGRLTTACAILIHPEGFNEYVGELFVFFDTPPYLVEVFTKEAVAITWLKTYMPALDGQAAQILVD